MTAVTAYLALGSNLGDRETAIFGAISRISELPSTTLQRQSDLMETEPVDSPDDAGMFLNGVVQIETTLAAPELLTHLLDIEVALGRDRANAPKNAPRTIDLDILLYGETVLESERLTIPHPRMKQRLFVLWPLMQIAPRLTDPTNDELYADSLAALKAENASPEDN
ncbi:MAG: 2-amino-4-hydroxy-6-hydroxymethyldihydropteridine diphosphokinase [Planctomycetota bacterium]|jgi:2-amino-4-hydroxy-6-hydroxymethyldihydropteridine diphosphokinase